MKLRLKLKVMETLKNKLKSLDLYLNSLIESMSKSGDKAYYETIIERVEKDIHDIETKLSKF